MNESKQVHKSQLKGSQAVRVGDLAVNEKQVTQKEGVVSPSGTYPIVQTNPTK